MGAAAEGPAELATVVADRLVAGGEALARHPDGRVVLVAGALPGEQVEVEVRQRKGALRGSVRRMLWASPDRVRPRCPHVADGCGGCDLQTLEPGAQVRAKIDLVADSLRRLGHIAEPDRAAPARPCRRGGSAPPCGWRSPTVGPGCGGPRATRSSGSITVWWRTRCIDELVHEGRFGEATEVVVRVGAATGERMAVALPTAEGVVLPDDVLRRRGRRARGRPAGVDPRGGRRSPLADLGRVVLPDPTRRRRRAGRGRALDGGAPSWPCPAAPAAPARCSTPTAGSGCCPGRCSTVSRRLAGGRGGAEPLVGGRCPSQPGRPRRQGGRHHRRAPAGAAGRSGGGRSGACRPRSGRGARAGLVGRADAGAGELRPGVGRPRRRPARRCRATATWSRCWSTCSPTPTTPRSCPASPAADPTPSANGALDRRWNDG